MDDPDTGRGSKTRNLFSQLGQGTHAVSAGVGAADLFLCTENNAATISIPEQGHAAFYPRVAGARSTAPYFSSIEPSITAADFYIDHHLPVFI